MGISHPWGECRKGRGEALFAALSKTTQRVVVAILWLHPLWETGSWSWSPAPLALRDVRIEKGDGGQNWFPVDLSWECGRFEILDHQLIRQVHRRVGPKNWTSSFGGFRSSCFCVVHMSEPYSSTRYCVASLSPWFFPAKCLAIVPCCLEWFPSRDNWSDGISREGLRNLWHQHHHLGLVCFLFNYLCPPCRWPYLVASSSSWVLPVLQWVHWDHRFECVGSCCPGLGLSGGQLGGDCA